MNRSQQARLDGRAGELASLREVIIATGGQVKIQELYRLLTAEEAAQFLGLAKSTVRDMTYRDELPHVKVGRRGVRYRLIALIGWQDRRQHAARIRALLRPPRQGERTDDP